MRRLLTPLLTVVLGAAALTGARSQASAEPLGATARAAVTATSARWQQDWDGDGRPDLVVAATDGSLFLYAGTGRGGYESRRRIGTGWSGYDQVGQVGDFEGDGHADLVARRTSDGALFLYRGDGHGGFLGRRQIGTGWSPVGQVLAVGDWDGDGRPDLLGLRSAEQTLWLYPGDGHGGFGSRRQIGSGWQSRTAVTAVGDWDGDGRADLLARGARDGRLWLYPGRGDGGFRPARVVGSGFNTTTALVGAGDVNGDRTPDLLARRASGTLALYRGDGSGGFVTPAVSIGPGWGSYLLNSLPGYSSGSASVSAAQLPYSYRSGCPVRPASLRLVQIRYYGFDDRAHDGRLVVNADAERVVRAAFADLYSMRFPVRRMQLVDVYGGSDDRSMAADNTSAFNCRPVAGTSSWSQHAYGRAVDIDTVENPYVQGSHVSPPAGARFTDRTTYRRGMLTARDDAVRAFTRRGWGWGGAWSSSKDYQHVSANGR